MINVILPLSTVALVTAVTPFPAVNRDPVSDEVQQLANWYSRKMMPDTNK